MYTQLAYLFLAITGITHTAHLDDRAQRQERLEYEVMIMDKDISNYYRSLSPLRNRIQDRTSHKNFLIELEQQARAGQNPEVLLGHINRRINTVGNDIRAVNRQIAEQNQEIET